MAFGYIHEEYPIDFELPKTIKSLVDDLEEFDKTEDYRYYTVEESLDIQCKLCYGEGEITKKQWETLVRRYWSEE